MTTAQITALGPMLVSELPPVPAQQRRHASRLSIRRATRRFELALRLAESQERVDLLAQERAQRTVTRTLT
jgi:hypothetical protein